MNMVQEDQQQVHTQVLIQVGVQTIDVYGLLHVLHTYKTLLHLVTQQLDKKSTAHYTMAVMIQLFQTTLHKLYQMVSVHGCLTMVELKWCQCLHIIHILVIYVNQVVELVQQTVTTLMVHLVRLQKVLMHKKFR